MIPDFLIDFIERLGTVDQDKFYQKQFHLVSSNSSSSSIIGGNRLYPSSPPLLKTSMSQLVPHYIITTNNNNNDNSVLNSFPSSSSSSSSLLLSAAVPTLTTDLDSNNGSPSSSSLAGSSLPTTTTTTISIINDSTTLQPADNNSSSSSSLYNIFNSFSMAVTFDQSGYSFYDDDWDPITRTHTVQHELTTLKTDDHTLSHHATSALAARNKTMMTEAASQKYWEADATYIVIVFIFPILLVIGTLGNLLTYIVLQRKTFTDKTAASWLFKCLAFMCTICLWVGLPRHWLRAYFGFDIRQLHFLLCQFHRFTLYCAMDITTWIIVSISADRLVAVLLPFKAHFISTPRNAKRMFIGLCMFFAVFNAHIFFTYGRRYATKSAAPTTITTHHLHQNYSTTPALPRQLFFHSIPAARTTTTPLLISSSDIIVDVDDTTTTTSGLLMISLRKGNKNKKTATTTSTTTTSTTSATPAITTVVVSECQERDIPEILFYNRIIHPWMSFAMYVIGPFCFMLASSITIARKLAERRAFLKRSQGNKSALASLITINVNKFATAVRVTAHGGSIVEVAKPLSEALDRAAANSSQRSTTMLLFAASIEFLITATPAFFLDIAEKPLKQSGMFNSPHGMAQFQLLYTAVRLMLFSNFALHFFLFCLSAHRFRREVVKVICCGRNSAARASPSSASGRHRRHQPSTLQQKQTRSYSQPELMHQQSNDPASSSSCDNNSSMLKTTSKFSDAVWRVLSKVKRASRISVSTVDGDDDETSVSNNNNNNNNNNNTNRGRRISLRLNVGTTRSTELPHLTTPMTTCSTPKLTVVDENELMLAPPIVILEPGGCNNNNNNNNNINNSNDFLPVTSSPATLSTTGCHTGTTSTTAEAAMTANSCADLVMMMTSGNVSNNDDYDMIDDGCCDVDYSSGAEKKCGNSNNNNNNNNNKEALMSPVAKAVSDALANLPPPPVLSMSTLSAVRSPSDEATLTADAVIAVKPISTSSAHGVDAEVDNTLLTEDVIGSYLLRYESEDLDNDDSVTTRGNSTDSYTTTTTFSELGIDDDLLKLKLFRGLSLKSDVASVKSNNGDLKNSQLGQFNFVNNISEPLLVTIINGTGSGNQSFDNDNDDGGGKVDDQVSSLVKGGGAAIQPPLAKLDSDFFRVQSRNSIASLSQQQHQQQQQQQQQKPIYRLSDSTFSSFNSMKSHVVAENRHNMLGSHYGSNNKNNSHIGNNSSYYYYYYNSNNNNNNNNKGYQNPSFSKLRKKVPDGSGKSVVYVYLTDPLLV